MVKTNKQTFNQSNHAHSQVQIFQSKLYIQLKHLQTCTDLQSFTAHENFSQATEGCPFWPSLPPLPKGLSQEEKEGVSSKEMRGAEQQ